MFFKPIHTCFNEIFYVVRNKANISKNFKIFKMHGSQFLLKSLYILLDDIFNNLTCCINYTL